MQRILGSNDVIPPGAKILVKREPVDSNLYKQYCRKVSPTHKEWVKMGDEERLDYVLGMTFSDCVYVGDAAALESQKRPVVAYDPDVQCSICGRVGHREWNCHKKNERGFIPLARRHMPHGIPQNRLRAPQSEEEIDRAYRLLDGSLVVVI